MNIFAAPRPVSILPVDEEDLETPPRRMAHAELRSWATVRP